MEKTIFYLIVIALIIKTGFIFATPNEDLLSSAANGDIAGVKKALAERADVNAKSNDGSTALMIASEKGHIEIAKLLIANRADVNAKVTSGLLTGWTALILASENGHFEIVKLLIANHADVNVKVISGLYVGWTALMIASCNGHLEILKLLIANRADVNAKSNNGGTALILASETGYLEIVKLLITNRADVNAKSKNGSTTLMKASGNGHIEIVKLLIANRADVNAKDNNGFTALMLASAGGHLSLVKLLIKSGADINAKITTGDFQGKNALECAENDFRYHEQRESNYDLSDEERNKARVKKAKLAEVVQYLKQAYLQIAIAQNRFDYTRSQDIFIDGETAIGKLAKLELEFKDVDSGNSISFYDNVGGKYYDLSFTPEQRNIIRKMEQYKKYIVIFTITGFGIGGKGTLIEIRSSENN